METLVTNLEQDVKQTAFEARETADMIYAANILLRMAYGAASFVPGVADNKDEAGEFIADFQRIFKRLKDTYDHYIGVYKENTPVE